MRTARALWWARPTAPPTTPSELRAALSRWRHQQLWASWDAAWLAHCAAHCQACLSAWYGAVVSLLKVLERTAAYTCQSWLCCQAALLSLLLHPPASQAAVAGHHAPHQGRRAGRWPLPLCAVCRSPQRQRGLCGGDQGSAGPVGRHWRLCLHLISGGVHCGGRIWWVGGWVGAGGWRLAHRWPAVSHRVAASILCLACCTAAPGQRPPLNPPPACRAACDESSPVAKLGVNERTDRLLAAEQAVLEAGGCVVRLVGLYHAQR